MASLDLEAEQPLYIWVDEAEDLEIYRIVHKLGFGSYSTVWLARDQQLNRFVAIKFTIASASASSETKILHHIQVSDHQHPGRKFVTTLLDDFELEGPNGRHRCLITEALVKIVSRSAKGFAFLHSCGVVHGDFHYNNILIEIPGFHSWSVEKVYRCLGKPKKILVKRTDGNPTTPTAPTYVVRPPDPLQLAKLVFDSDDFLVKITDFGESFLAADLDKPNLNTAISLAASEILFEDSINSKVDIWSFACLVYEMLSNHGFLESFFNDRDEIIIEMVRTFGKLPERWWKKWQNRDQFFEEDGTFKPDSGDSSGEPRTVNLKERLENIRRNDEKGQKELSGDLEALELVLGKMLQYEPEERINIDEVVSLLPF